MATEGKAIIFYRCNFFSYFVSIDERPAMDLNQTWPQSIGSGVDLFTRHPILSTPLRWTWHRPWRRVLLVIFIS